MAQIVEYYLVTTFWTQYPDWGLWVSSEKKLNFSLLSWWAFLDTFCRSQGPDDYNKNDSGLIFIRALHKDSLNMRWFQKNLILKNCKFFWSGMHLKTSAKIVWFGSFSLSGLDPYTEESKNISSTELDALKGGSIRVHFMCLILSVRNTYGFFSIIRLWIIMIVDTLMKNVNAPWVLTR